MTAAAALKIFLFVEKFIIRTMSDAILHAKYQLIYTVGKQIQIDGGSKRWFVTQALLKRVPYHMKRLYDELGEKYDEFNVVYVRNGNVYGAPKVDYRDDVFTSCRILDEQTIFPLLKEAPIEDFLDGKTKLHFPKLPYRPKRCFELCSVNGKSISKHSIQHSDYFVLKCLSWFYRSDGVSTMASMKKDSVK